LSIGQDDVDDDDVVVVVVFDDDVEEEEEGEDKKVVVVVVVAMIGVRPIPLAPFFCRNFTAFFFLRNGLLILVPTIILPIRPLLLSTKMRMEMRWCSTNGSLLR
jgi:hypothetical protein